MEHNIKRSVTIYSWHRQVEDGLMTWEDCIRAAVKMGCSGIELLGQLYFRYCPEPLQEDIDSWNELMFKYGTKTICHDFFVDMTLYNHRRLTVREGVDIVRRHAEFAKKIGCPIIRLGGTALPEIAKASVPILEDLGIRMGQELHNGTSSFAQPWTQELLNVIEQENSPYLGIIPDMSMFTKRISESTIKDGIKKGVDEKFCREVAAMFESVPNEEYRTFCKKTMDTTNDFAVKNWLGHVHRMEYFNPDILRQLTPHIVHCHGKFYEMDENCMETSIDYEGVLNALKAGGYNGYISAEYEGKPIDNDTFEPFRRFEKMLDHYLGTWPDSQVADWPDARPANDPGFGQPSQQAISGTLENVYDQDGNAVGFSVELRNYYYRGVPLALFESAHIKLDGDIYGPDSMTVEVDGETFRFEDMADVTLHYWNKGYPAKIIVKKPGGISKGTHDITAVAEIRAYYMREGFATARSNTVRFAPSVKMNVTK